MLGLKKHSVVTIVFGRQPVEIFFQTIDPTVNFRADTVRTNA